MPGDKVENVESLDILNFQPQGNLGALELRVKSYVTKHCELERWISW